MSELFKELSKYRLYFDGTIEAHDPEKTFELLLLGVKPEKVTTRLFTDDISMHNQLVDEEIEKIHLSKSSNELLKAITPLIYKLPYEYSSLDFAEFVKSKLELIPMTAQDMLIAKSRVDRELQEIEKRNIEPLFKTIIYVVDMFKKQNIVYGVGRGSSCACYILFLIGLNLVNPLKYNIPIEEFFH